MPDRSPLPFPFAVPVCRRLRPVGNHARARHARRAPAAGGARRVVLSGLVRARSFPLRAPRGLRTRSTRRRPSRARVVHAVGPRRGRRARRDRRPPRRTNFADDDPRLLRRVRAWCTASRATRTRPPSSRCTCRCSPRSSTSRSSCTSCATGRDVVLSRMEAAWGSHRVDFEALQWRSHIRRPAPTAAPSARALSRDPLRGDPRRSRSGGTRPVRVHPARLRPRDASLPRTRPAARRRDDAPGGAPQSPEPADQRACGTGGSSSPVRSSR